MIFQWEGVHGAIRKFLIAQGGWIEPVVKPFILQEFLHIHKISCIHKFLAVRICVNINDVRHLSACNQGLKLLEIGGPVCRCLNLYLPFSSFFFAVLLGNLPHGQVYFPVHRP